MTKYIREYARNIWFIRKIDDSRSETGSCWKYVAFPFVDTNA
jgi:hypothetical protein